MSSTAQNIASSIVSLSHGKGDPVSNLKLQKLIYYAQAWHLAIYRKPLFGDDIEAWVHGPVVPDVFRRYRSYKWAFITEEHTQAISGRERAHLEEVWRIYGGLSAYQLEKLTHSEDPWKQARAGLSPDESSHEIITHNSMRTYYASRLRG